MFFFIVLQNGGAKPPAPTRGLQKGGGDSAGEDEGEDAEADEGGDNVNVADLVPRNEIRSVI